MSGPIFETIYRDKLWRVGLTEYEGQRRVSIWSPYRDRQTSDWRPCGGRRESPGFFVEADRVHELATTLGELAAVLRSSTRVSA